MKNRAKCKLCQSVIESFHATDYVICKCGEIAIDGGPDNYKVSATDFSNFLRVDDNDNEIIVKVQEKPEDVKQLDIDTKPSREDLLRMLDDMIKNIDDLPPQAKITAINHYDFGSLLSLLSLILKS